MLNGSFVLWQAQCEDPQNPHLSLLFPPSPLFLFGWYLFLTAYDLHWIRRRHLRSRVWRFRVGGGTAILNLLMVRFRSLRSSLWVSGIVSVLSACKWAGDRWGKCSLICSACALQPTSTRVRRQHHESLNYAYLYAAAELWNLSWIQSTCVATSLHNAVLLHVLI